MKRGDGQRARAGQLEKSQMMNILSFRPFLFGSLFGGKVSRSVTGGLIGNNNFNGRRNINLREDLLFWNIPTAMMFRLGVNSIYL